MHQMNVDSWKSIPRRVNLNWWKRDFGGAHNFGDMLSPVVVEYMLRKRSLSLTTPVRKTRHLSAAGSVLLWTDAYQDVTVWGSGLLRDGLGLKDKRLRNWLIHHLMHRVDVRCVRGPETRRLLQYIGLNCPEAYGDPAVLLPEIYRPEVAQKRDYNVIPHFSDRERFSGAEGYLDIITDDWRVLTDRICSARVNISGSLHGIIVSEAYGIPAILLLPDQSGKEKPVTLFKFRDYYLSTGRKDFPVARTVAEALKMQPPEIPDFDYMRRTLKATFPYDLWKK